MADRLSELSDEALQSPSFAPTVAVEVLSPHDDPRDVDSKVEVYLRAGSALVIVIDPAAKAITLYDKSASALLRVRDTLCHSSLPGFELPSALILQTPSIVCDVF